MDRRLILALFAGCFLFSLTARAGVTCDRRSAWPGGAVFDCHIDSPPQTTSAIGWTVSFRLDAQITQAWNSAIVDNGEPRKRLGNLSYNGSLNQQVIFGFIANSETAIPSDIVLEAQLPPPPPPVIQVDVPLPQPGYLAARGSRLVNSKGNEVRLAGVSWFGMETSTRAPHGLWIRSYKELLQKVKHMGFNFVRVPFSNDIFKPQLLPNGIDFNLNPELKGLSALQILDRVVAHAKVLGLKIMLDRHRPNSSAQSELWYTSGVSEAKWISDWVALAKRYANNSTVFAVDLHNEPHGQASWGTGNLSTDWRLAAERAGNAILKTNPNLLILVEGIEHTGNDWYWWGGNLADAGSAPVRLSIPGRLVYSAHDYPASVHEQSWFREASFPSNLPGIWRAHWGFLVESGTAPVILGEFGTKLATQRDELWLDTLVSYLKGQGIGFAFWSLNPNSGDTGGLLENDWVTIDTLKLRHLAPALPAPLVQ